MCKFNCRSTSKGGRANADPIFQGPPFLGLLGDVALRPSFFKMSVFTDYLSVAGNLQPAISITVNSAFKVMDWNF